MLSFDTFFILVDLFDTDRTKISEEINGIKKYTFTIFDIFITYNV
jgi:hypothetical protein